VSQPIHLPFDLSSSDPNFTRDILRWASQTQSEMNALVLVTKGIIAATKDMIAEADRILAQKPPA
jgi:hypothetical protein